MAMFHSIMRNLMKISKIFIGILLAAILSISQAISQAIAQNTAVFNPPPAFLQDIQSRLSIASGDPKRVITLLITTEEKRVVRATPSMIHFSYGFLKQMASIDQLVATMAHMTAHISLDYMATPPLPEDVKDSAEKSSVGTYLKSAVRPDYPDESSFPEASGAFHDKGPGAGVSTNARPGYHNKNYDYAVNKAGIVKAERELEVDKITSKILSHAGFCPADYNRMLRYFYEKPQKLIGNKHFALDADQWQRLDTLDRTVDPAAPCSQAQNNLTQKYSAEFDQLKITISRKSTDNKD